jgi:hypothetical protein
VENSITDILEEFGGQHTKSNQNHQKSKSTSMQLAIPAAILFFTSLSIGSCSTIICPGTGSNSDCKCQITEGISCPAGFYCPGYSTEQMTDYSKQIAAANCTVRLDGELQCPCTPGFYCPENTLTPSYCCAGVIESILSINIYDLSTVLL